MPGSLREKTWWAENRDLYNLLLKFSESEASDPRDKVYALLGISSDAQDTNSLRPDYTKDLKKVIYGTYKFLFGPWDVKYETMPEFLADLTSQSDKSFRELARMSDVGEVDRFLKRRGLDVPVSEDLMIAAARNEENGLEIIKLLYQRRRDELRSAEEKLGAIGASQYLDINDESRWIPDGVIKAARENKASGLDILTFFAWVKKGGYSTGTETFLLA
ncbi:unnamed protein product [Alternaria alternata]